MTVKRLLILLFSGITCAAKLPAFQSRTRRSPPAAEHFMVEVISCGNPTSQEKGELHRQWAENLSKALGADGVARRLSEDVRSGRLGTDSFCLWQ